MYVLLSVLVALLITLTNSSNFLSGVVGTKPGEVYLGTTHYYEDYFLYLNQFFQGAHGGWLTLNRYTSEPTAASILFWPNVLLGKLGGLIGLSPELSYNTSVMFLSFFVLLTIASLMSHVFPKDKTKAFIGFLLAALSTSLINHIWVDGKPMWYPFQLWKTPNFALDRLGGVPHQIVQTLLFLLAMHVYFFYRPKKFSALLSLLVLPVLLVLLSSLNPVMSALFIGVAWITHLLTRHRNKSALVPLIVTTVSVAAAAWYYHLISGLPPHNLSKLWEAGQQIMTTPLFMLLSIGPISILGIIGTLTVIRRARPVEIFSMVLLTVCYLLYFSPIPKLIGISNSRVLFPALYAAWGILGVLGIEALATQLVIPAYAGIQRILNWILGSSPRMTINKSFLIVFLSLFFLTVSFPTLKWEFGQKLVIKPEERIPLLYLPGDVFKAFTYIKNQGTFDDVVLGNPASHMDALLPALTGHSGYTGHPFATISNENKKAESMKLFQLKMTTGEAKQWLNNNTIRFILFTKFDGDIKRFWITYPFLKVLFTTPQATALETL
ncbi:hypothetical protein HY949_03940 [Candidatus Gottesmanbacteria bacterium]|nr:hypothetical protein [Candidatus Gottesmanbacteria bacterium]